MESQEKVLEISPLGKGRRILSFLADFFLVFIITISLFHFAFYPLGKAIVGYENKGQEYLTAKVQRDSVLYGNGLLFSPTSKSREESDFDSNLSYTFTIYLGGLVASREEVNIHYDQQPWDIFAHYYADLSGGDITTFYLETDQNTFFESYFPLKLKAVYEDEFIHAYIQGDTMSEKGQSDYEEFQDRFFLDAYRKMLADIEAKDLTYNGVSYTQNQKIVTSFIELEKNLIVGCVFPSYFFANVIVMLVFPLISKRRKTLSMIFMRYERLDSSTLNILKRRRVWPFFLMSLFFNMGSLLFVPLGLFDFVSLFSLPALFPLSVIGLLYVLASFIILLFDGYNRTLADKATFTVMVDESTLDEIFRAKGYSF